MSGLTPHERVAVLSLREVFQAYVEGLCGDLKYSDAWRKYGAFNSTTHDYEFYPGWFLGPLQMMLDFQAAIVHTQMFVSYIDRRRYEEVAAASHSDSHGSRAELRVGRLYLNGRLLLSFRPLFTFPQGGGPQGAPAPTTLPDLHWPILFVLH